MTRECEHYVCRCAAAARMALVYDRTGRGEHLQRAIEAHDQRVPCQLEQEPEAVQPTDYPKP